MNDPATMPEVPELEIVPVEALRPHEHIDPGRAKQLWERLRADGMLRNPPIVIRAGERSDQLVVLDGATRLEALRMLGLRHILVQVVHAGVASVRLETWGHALRGLEARQLVEAIEYHPELALVRSDEERAAFRLSAGSTLAYLLLRGGEVLEVVADSEPLMWRVTNLNRLVGSYAARATVERVPTARQGTVEKMYAEMVALVVFRRLDLEDVVRAATSGLLLPAGLTRFIVSPRALRVNYPLDELADSRSLEAKRGRLVEWLRDRVAGRHVRYYAEATFLFDE